MDFVNFGGFRGFRLLAGPVGDLSQELGIMICGHRFIYIFAAWWII